VKGLGARVRVGKSAVHGRGLFARTRLRKGAHIGTFEGELTIRDGEHVLWVLAEDGTREGILGRNVLRFLNHDVRPNAEFEGAELYALRNIQPGAELFIDYGDDWR
jgi:SET domain-containing protein